MQSNIIRINSSLISRYYDLSFNYFLSYKMTLSVFPHPSFHSQVNSYIILYRHYYFHLNNKIQIYILNVLLWLTKYSWKSSSPCHCYSSLVFSDSLQFLHSFCAKKEPTTSILNLLPSLKGNVDQNIIHNNYPSI